MIRGSSPAPVALARAARVGTSLARLAGSGLVHDIFKTIVVPMPNSPFDPRRGQKIGVPLNDLLFVVQLAGGWNGVHMCCLAL